MSSLNTLREYQRIVDAGVDPKHAIAQIEATFNILNLKTDNLLTRDEMKLIMSEFMSEFKLLHKDFWWVKACVLSLVAIIIGPLIKDLF